MNPYNQQYPHNYPQHTPGPPQPQWQTPPRRQGWVDPRAQQQQQQAAQSPISSFQQHLGYPPPPPPPPPTQSPHPQPGQYDTSAWGVKYNQNQAPQSEEHRPQWNQQSEEYKPPLPPRPSSSTAHHGATPQSEQWNAGLGVPNSQPAASWQDPYHNQGQTASYEIPPPPPPRPPEYQAQMQAQAQADSLHHQYYSHQPPSHHYEPQVQKPQTPIYPAKQHGMTFASPDRPSHMAYPSADSALISPIEPGAHHWPQQTPATGMLGAPALQAPKPENYFFSSALGTGGPSDWEHFSDGQNASPEMSSPPPMFAGLPQPPTLSSPPQMPAAIAQSPVSPQKPTVPMAQDLERPEASPHRSSDTSSIPTQGIQRTGTIDSVIQAWNTPLNVSAKPLQQADSRPGSREQGQTLLHDHAVERVVEKVVDPYDDLEPEYKASLKRYVAMLRKETAADTDETKFDIFQLFVKKELRLRSMLYGIEAEMPESQLEKKADRPLAKSKQEAPAPSDKASAVVTSTPSMSSQSIPVPLPVPTSTVKDTSLPQATALQAPSTKEQLAPSEQTTPVVEPREGSKRQESGHLSKAAVSVPNREPARSGPITTPPPLKTPATDAAVVSPPSKEDSHVTIDAGEDEAEYSPGGRPRMNRLQTATSRANQPPGNIAQSGAETRDNRASPSADAPMVLEDYAMAQPPSPGANAPMPMEPDFTNHLPQVVMDGYGSVGASSRSQSDKATSDKKNSSVPAIKFEPSRPAYLPFKYNPTVQAPTQSADQSYSSMRKDAVDSGRLLVHEPSSKPDSMNGSRSSSPGAPKPQDEAFIGLIRSQSKAVRPRKTPSSSLSAIPQLRPGTPRASSPAAEPFAGKDNPLVTATKSLKSMLPETVPESYGLSKHAKGTALKAKLDGFTDNFSFIHEAVIAWDRQNREVRKKQDDERDARQADSEAHIDGLFNDNEIGYADIGNLEAGFKLAEAEHKYQEDQQELESFTKGVYQPVTERLQKDLSELSAQYTIAVDLLDLQSEPASGCLKPDNSKAEMGYVMNCVLSLFNKIEIRHQKVAEADVERERRRKRLELTVLYTNGDTPGVKKLEQEFAEAEKMQVLHEARARDTRANKTMDTFDRATVRGLGDNQTYVDDLLVRIRELKELILKDPSNISQDVYAPQGPRDTLSLAQRAVDLVLADSQKLLTVSNVADKMLNDADYSVSVAEARVSNADQATYQKLASEKEKEDAKIVEDTNSRMTSIAKAPEEAIALIREVVDKIGNDAEHQERMKKALEAARQRNAANEAGP